MPQKLSNAARSLLTGSISSDATSMVVEIVMPAGYT